MLEEEKVKARALLASETRELERAQSAKERRVIEADAAFDAVEERAKEARGARAALSTSLLMLGNISAFVSVSGSVARATAEKLLQEVQAGSIGAADGFRYLTRLDNLSKSALTQLEQAMRIVRLHLGEPDSTIGIMSPVGSTWEVDGSTAVSVLGEERLKAAVIDLANGKISTDAELLIDWQATARQG